MRKKFLLFISLGMISLVGQTVLLRELLIEVRGNEIVYAIYLSLWLFMIAVGSFIGKFLLQKDRLQSYIKAGFLLLSFLVILQFFGIRIFAGLLTVVSGEMFELGNIFLLALLILTSGCLVMGSLFPLLCSYIKNVPEPVHKGYVLESIGIILGGVLFAGLISILSHITMLIVLGMVNLVILFLLMRKKYLIIPLIIFLIMIPFIEKLFKQFYAEKYSPQELILSRDSKYGRLDVTKSQAQQNYYWNGELFAHTDNELYAQQMVNFVMLQNPEARKILLIGGLLRGYIPEITKYERIKRIDCLEMDENIIAIAPQHPDVHYIQDDPIHYLRTSSDTYEIIFVDVPDPSSLLLNRFYTLQFFELAKKHFSSSSAVLAITLSSGTNFMTPELVQLNASVWKTFSKVFHYSIIIPSIKNIYIGSEESNITNDVEELQQRAQNYQSIWFNDTVIFEQCNPLRIGQIHNAIEGRGELNTIADPAAYLSTISVWTNILDLNISSTMQWMKRNVVFLFLFSIFVILGIAFGASKLNRISRSLIDMQVFVVSLVNFVMQLVLLNLFQMQYGNVYFMIFLFTTIFMLGLTCGFLLRNKLRFSLYILYVFNLILAGFVFLFFENVFPAIIYLICNLIFAFLEGSILAKLLAVKYEIEKIESGSTFYFMDSLGSMVGGLIIGVVLFPVIGIKSSILMLMCLLGVNMALQFKKRIHHREHREHREHQSP
ncbi:MAG: hypothetical protein H8E22_02290 [Candidatus Cloacimonetes bacterium]|nr:hypothetical protein [Candidatus Cloacimonadota bacterium]